MGNEAPRSAVSGELDMSAFSMESLVRVAPGRPLHRSAARVVASEGQVNLPKTGVFFHALLVM